MCTKWKKPLARPKGDEGVPISWETWVPRHSLWGCESDLGRQ